MPEQEKEPKVVVPIDELKRQVKLIVVIEI